MSSVLFRVWLRIQRIIQNTTSSVWFRIQRIIQSIIQNTTSVLFGIWFRIQDSIKKCPGYFSASGSVFRVLFKIRPAASGSGFSVLLKMSRLLFSVWFRIQRIIKNCPGYYSESGSRFSVLLKNVQSIILRLVQDSAYYYKLSRLLFGVWFRIQRVNQGIVQNTTSSVWFRIQRIIKKCPGYYYASVSGFSVLLKNVQGIIQHMVQYSAYY